MMTPGGAREIEDLWFHRYRPSAGDVIVDVGAGIGAAARVFSRAVGAGGRVVAVEPHPRACRQLEAAVRDGPLANVQVVRCAVSDRAGWAALTDLDDFEKNTLRTDSERCSTVQVRTRTLDDLTAHLGLVHIDFLKMNIEGAERLVVPAMDRTLAMSRAVAIACHDFVADLKGDPWFRTKALVTDCLRSRGFEVHTRGEDPRVYVRDYVYARR
jgi:FkbM family methyltransferase